MQKSCPAVLDQFIQSNNADDVSLDAIAIMAQAGAEWGGISNVIQGQGFFKDERSRTRECPIFSSNSMGGGISVTLPQVGVSFNWNHANSQFNPPGRDEIECIYGNTNCTEVPC